MPRRLILLAAATLVWAKCNPLSDPHVTVNRRYGAGVHGSDLLPLAALPWALRRKAVR